MLTLISPATCTCALSIGLNPARSSISLAASNCTCSDLAPCARVITFAAAIVALRPSWSWIRDIIYCCTCGSRIVLLALTLPDSPCAYPASAAACLIEHPVATSVSTRRVCFGVSFFPTKLVICYSLLPPSPSLPPSIPRQNSPLSTHIMDHFRNYCAALPRSFLRKPRHSSKTETRVSAACGR